MIILLKTFEPLEFREFGKFVASPFHNGRKEVIKFFEIIKLFYPGFDSNKFSKYELFRKLYPSKEYDDSAIRKLASFLTKLAEDYIAYVGLRRDDFYPEMSLIISLSDRGLHGLAAKKLQLIEEKFKLFNGDSEFFFWKKFLIERHKSAAYSYTHQDHLASETILKRTDNISYHMTILLSKGMMDLKLYEKNFNVDYSKSDFNRLILNIDLETFIQHLKTSNNGNYPVIAINYYESMAFLHPENDMYFTEFRTLLKNETHKFSFVEQVNYYSMFEAICTLKIESGRQEFSKELFDVYKEMLEKKLYSYYPGGQFILRIFRNIVHTGIALKEYSWLEGFLERYMQELPPDSRKSMGNLANALLLFEKGEFERSLEKLVKIDYELFHFKIDIKTLHLKIYYALNCFDEAYSLIDTYKHFISSNKFISLRYRERAGAFLDILKRLLDLKLSKNPENSGRITKDFYDKTSILEKDWLALKISEINQ
ncbi:MAG: hypothetical protein K8I03_02880 [Ignavibacteria bacterium]|nr:hypothetical protein [Ignavibacteria bacterium]